MAKESAAEHNEKPHEDFDDAYRLQLAITRLARMLRQEVDAGLTQSQISALSTIRRDGPMTLGDLAEAERVAPPSITRMVDRLEAEGYIDRIPDSTDRRVCRVHVTELAEKMVAEARRTKTAWLLEQMADLPVRQRRALLSAVDAVEGLAGLQ
ncbi:MAG: MarR family transcriptional regulator [Actinomycetia bacterium]|nr:MarR family transcriptional regulator [Actinomycetes bacterium]